jgi:hypothetical protein
VNEADFNIRMHVMCQPVSTKWIGGQYPGSRPRSSRLSLEEIKQLILDTVRENPGATPALVAYKTSRTAHDVSNLLRLLMNSNELTREPHGQTYKYTLSKQS